MIAGNDQERRLMKFSGKYKDWSYWEEIFMIQASRMGFGDVLKGIIKMPLASEDQDLPTDGSVKTTERDSREKQVGV